MSFTNSHRCSPALIACLLGVAAAISGAQPDARAADTFPAPEAWPAPQPAPATPGQDYTPPVDSDAEPNRKAPRIYEHSTDAGPVQTFFAVGSGLTNKAFAWGRSADDVGGRPWELQVPMVDLGYLTATLPERAYDSLMLVWFGNEAGWSRPIRLNAPQPWWCWPKEPVPGTNLRIFGRDLGRRPDRTTAFVYLAAPGKQGRWLPVQRAGKYDVALQFPADVPSGEYQLWLHGGAGGQYGWSEPLTVRVRPAAEPRPTIPFSPPDPPHEPVDLNAALNDLAARGGGTLTIGPGVFPFQGTIRVPAGVTLAGAGRDQTRLQLVQCEPSQFARIGDSGWNRGPGGIHTPGDTIEYRIDVPTAGTWTVWLRYATEMSKWNQPGVSGNMTLQVDQREPVPLQNLPNTGSFGTFRWSRSAALEISAGEHTLQWKNVKGGGLSLDAIVLALDPNYQPSENPWPQPIRELVVVQGEDVTRFDAKDGSLPGRMRTAIWLSGDGAGIENLSVSGTPQVGYGVLITGEDPLKRVRGCRVEGCRIADMEDKDVDISAVRLISADAATVRNNELWGRTPLYLSGVRYSNLSDNRLVPITRFGGNAEAAIQGRNEVIEECVIENNIVACPPGVEAGGAQVRRLIWVSTGRGSITKNWFAGNGVTPPKGPGAATGAGQMRFGGTAGTDQNVGEMILFEANHRTMYFGPLADADSRSVTLPKTIPATPDQRLGSVKREQLAHDADGNETPFWPPADWDDSSEPPIGEYYVTIFQGPGQGQSRRVVTRDGERLLLDRPWRTPPAPGSVAAVGTAFYRNLIVDNHTADGMTGVQLWISCIENVVSGNTIARQRKPGVFLYANGTTLASSMPRTWNRGISPLFFNHIEGNRTDECSTGALVTSGDYPDVPIEFPRALGNVLRHNSFHRSRQDGIVIVSRKGEAAAGDSSPSILGTIAEFNVVRDAVTGYRSSFGSDAAVFRRNHAWFWYPVNNATDLPVAFRVDVPDANIVIDQNSVEGKTGVFSPSEVIPMQKPETEAEKPETPK